MKHLSFFLGFVGMFFLLHSTGLTAQTKPRLFLDIPTISVISPDVQKFNDQFGVGMSTALNFGTHWGMVRAGGGLDMSVLTRNITEKESLEWLPFAQAEAGLGMFRTNGNRCASHHQSAFTAMPVGGYRYDFASSSGRTFAGAEFGYFYIRDMFRNQEFFLRGDYYFKDKTVAARVGFRLFLNLLANR